MNETQSILYFFCLWITLNTDDGRTQKGVKFVHLSWKTWKTQSVHRTLQGYRLSESMLEAQNVVLD